MNATIMRLAASALLGQRRVWALVAFPAVLIGLAILLRLTGAGSDGYQLITMIGYPIVMPLVALLAANSVLGPEMDDGSVVYLLAKPVSRHVVVVSKFVVAWAVTMVAGVVPLYVTGLVLNVELANISKAWTVGAVIAGTTYCAVFIAFSAYTRFAIIGGLSFVLIWEGMLGGSLSGIAWVSIRQWGTQIAHVFDRGVSAPDLPVGYALGACAVVTVLALWFAGDRLRSFTFVGGDSD